jgi:hypothetical protein
VRNPFRPREEELGRAATLALRLTAIVLLLQPVPIWYLRPVLISLAVLVVALPSVLRTPAAWGAMAILLAVRVIRLWPTPDNHHYLYVYWALAIFLALLADRPGLVLGRAARWLVVGVFLWATLWKGLLSPDYMDGRFYRVRLLTDPRFAEIARLVGDLTPEQVEGARAYLKPPPFGEPQSQDPRLVESPGVNRLALFLTWATLLIEGGVALAFLLPWGRHTLAVRHGALFAFCGSAYAIAPVAGFGWILCAMGAAQVPDDRRGLLMAYVVVFLLLRFYLDVPWERFLLAIRA